VHFHYCGVFLLCVSFVVASTFICRITCETSPSFSSFTFCYEFNYFFFFVLTSLYIFFLVRFFVFSPSFSSFTFCYEFNYFFFFVLTSLYIFFLVRFFVFYVI
jgi:hypothetical protein